MTQLAKNVLKSLMQTGELTWSVSSSKSDKIILTDERARRLLAIIAEAAAKRQTIVSDGKKVSATEDSSLFRQLESAWLTPKDAQSDVAAEASQTVTASTFDVSMWFLERIETSGFGGLNGPQAQEPFVLELAADSMCLFGGNGSGKSSLMSAIAWALTGQRLDDSTGLSDSPNRLRPVYDPNEHSSQIGEWPPSVHLDCEAFGTQSPHETQARKSFLHHGPP